MSNRPSILFSGYAPVHFLCFEPIFKRLVDESKYRIVLSGGFRKKEVDNTFSYRLEGFYDAFDTKNAEIISVAQAKQTDFDALVCSHLSNDLFPRSVRKTIQIFHGVSFKNYSVREKALQYDVLCLPGKYHADLYRRKGLIRDDGTTVCITGFAKTDALFNRESDREFVVQKHGLDGALPIVLYAPTGDKKNSLELMGETILELLSKQSNWNILVKPHDHPKKKINWFKKLAKFQNDRLKIVRDKDVIPLLQAADLLISDASSVITEFTLLDRPIVLLDVPELFERVLKRGGLLDLDTFGQRVGPVVSDPSTICDVITREINDGAAYSSVRRAMAEQVFYDPGSATDRICRVIDSQCNSDTSFPADVEILSAIDTEAIAEERL